MSSPEVPTVKPGEIVMIGNVRVGRAVGRAMLQEGNVVYVRATMLFNEKGQQVRLSEDFHIAVPTNYPGFKRFRPKESPVQNSGENPNFGY
jgi:hypothetical protein